MTVSRVPAATYRLQFHRGFTFAAAEKQAPYLHELGISDIYASPLFKARRGSLHGYSVTNPMEFNLELGSQRNFEALARKVKKLGMGIVVDIVPNHMALSPDNPWWMEVLENGPTSPYAFFFDIDWRPPNRLLEGKLLLPILGRPYGQALENQELQLTLEADGFFITYYEHRFPLAPKTYYRILASVLERLLQDLGEEHPGAIALMGIVSLIDNLPTRVPGGSRKVKDLQRDKEIIKKNLWLLYQGTPEIKGILDETISALNGRQGEPASFDALDRILQDQHYRLAHWQVALEVINYRRFFSINDLIGIRIEDPKVFDAFQQGLLFKLADDGKIAGLRVDHIDGLYDPLEYLQRLQHRLAAGGHPEAHFYIVVEKILASEESLPAEWPVAGTTGYDFLNKVNGVFIKETGLKDLIRIYTRFVETTVNLSGLIRNKKKLIMESFFGGEVENFVHYLSLLALQEREARDLSRRELTAALVEVLASLPIYRTYIRSQQVAPRDGDYLEWTFQEVRHRHHHLSRPALNFLHRVLRLDFPPYLSLEQRRQWLDVVMRLQQFTGPITAKGYEDTVFYIYNPLISLNEVGGDFQAVTPAEFHRFNQLRQQTSPDTMNATSTHDTKRSEDVRSRLNVLSEIPREWESCLRRWSARNRDRKVIVSGNLVPDRNQEIFLYQTMLGAWPLDPGELSAFPERLKAYMIKAAREAMVHTRWVAPQQDHEAGLTAFIEAILNDADFIKDFLELQGRVAYGGALNSLSQVLLKIVSPGVPDFYQGTELWDFSLVDPDNRRPVDFARRARALKGFRQQEQAGREALAAGLLDTWHDGRIKLYVTRQGLRLRRQLPELFRQGEYLPLKVQGRWRHKVVALARRHGDDWVLAVAGRFFAAIAAGGQPPVGREVWGGGRVILPPEAPAVWRDAFTGKACRVKAGPAPGLPLAQLLEHLPVALLTAAG